LNERKCSAFQVKPVHPIVKKSGRHSSQKTKFFKLHKLQIKQKLPAAAPIILGTFPCVVLAAQ
jgi:hypothetical protein